MPGSNNLKLEQMTLKALERGEATRTDLARELGFDPVFPPRSLDTLLQSMRLAGLIECHARGKWRLKPGVKVCSECHGRGIVNE